MAIDLIDSRLGCTPENSRVSIQAVVDLKRKLAGMTAMGHCKSDEHFVSLCRQVIGKRKTLKTAFSDVEIELCHDIVDKADAT